ncbi:MAG: TetR family transcriptional regulator [Pseudomonadales bacterium]|nr:TetR family transcriptional regulator [Pseudomonadales bacterium]
MPKLVDHNKRRKHFIISAMSVLASKGYSNFNLRAVAEEAGFTTGAMAHYFDDKEALLLAVFHFYADHMSSFVDKLMTESSDPKRKLERVLLSLLPIDDQHKAGWKIWFELSRLARSEKEYCALRRQLYLKWQQVLGCLIHNLLTREMAPDAVSGQMDAEHILAWLDGICLQVLTTPKDYSPERQMQLLDDFLGKLFCKEFARDF